jgi:hypothetical protein
LSMQRSNFLAMKRSNSKIMSAAASKTMLAESMMVSGRWRAPERRLKGEPPSVDRRASPRA